MTAPCEGGQPSSGPALRRVPLLSPQPGLAANASPHAENASGAAALTEWEAREYLRRKQLTMGAATPPQDRAADCHEAKTDCQNKVPSETPHTSCHQALEKLGMQIFGIPSSIFSPNTLLVQ